MSYPRLPQEISDYIVDLLQDEHQTLKQCCLVSKSWVPRTRKHIFRTIRFESPTDPAAWARIFPDPANSPGHLADSLHIVCVEDVVAAVVKTRDWFRSFSNVVRLEARSGTPIDLQKVFDIICFLPLLEDLDIADRGVTCDYQAPAPRLQTSPPLSGTLSLDLPRGMVRTTRSLLALPSGIHFRRLVCTRHLGIHFRYMTTLVEACSRTLESIDIRSHPLPTPVPWEGSIILSTATKLKEAVFQPVPCYVKWVATGLETIKSTHKDFREVKIIVPFLSTPPDEGFDEGVYTQWMDLDRVLVQLRRSHSVRVKLIYTARNDPEVGERVRDFIGSLLPEAIKGGGIELSGSQVALTLPTVVNERDTTYA